METTPPKSALQSYNSATLVIVTTLGVLLGISSINHGVCEIFQGNRPISAHVIKALGSGYRWTLWVHGSEPAFTLVPNFLVTGILATLIGLTMIGWSVRFIHRAYGPTVFLLLGVTSFLVGGGMAQVLLFTLNWAAATRIRSPLRFWRCLISPTVRHVIGKFWRWSLVAGVVFFVAASEIAVVGYGPRVPGQAEMVLRNLWGLGLAIVVSFLLSFVFGFAHDTEARR